MAAMVAVVLRNRFRTDGTPKVAYEQWIAIDRAREVDGEAYECDFCGGWHVGRRRTTDQTDDMEFLMRDDVQPEQSSIGEVVMGDRQENWWELDEYKDRKLVAWQGCFDEDDVLRLIPIFADNE